MKKNYKSPDFELLSLLTSDIVTLSVGRSSVDQDINGDYIPYGEPTESWKFN